MVGNTGHWTHHTNSWRRSRKRSRGHAAHQQQIHDLLRNRDCIIRPDTPRRLFWDVTGLSLILYDFLAIPFVFSFDIDSSDGTFLGFMDWITLLFWTGDMCQGFFLSYYVEGVLVRSHYKILRNYLRGWFVIDVLVVFPGWVVKFGDAWSSGQQIGLIGKVLKSVRAIRILRLVRLAKLQRILNSFYDRIEDERKFILIQLIKLLLLVSVMNHVIACAWFFIGTEMEKFGPSWTQQFLTDTKHSVLDEYLMSLHWSLTQFTPASMSVSATNEAERGFSIVVLFVAMVCFSSIVGSITGSMTTLRSMNNVVTRELWLVRRYMKQRNIDQDLRRRISKFLEFQVMFKSARVERGQLTILSKLSEDLSHELQHADFWPVVEEHPCFQLLQGEENARCTRLCGLCLNPRIWAESEVVFRSGDEGTLMYFYKELESSVLGGEVPALEFRHGPEDEKEPVNSGAWISEAVLWTYWRHLGELRCNSTCDLITVSPDKFAAAVRHHPRPWFLARGYGLLFLGWLNSLEVDEASDLLYDDVFRDHIKESTVNGGIASDELFATALETTDWYQAREGEVSPTFSQVGRKARTLDRLSRGRSGPL